MWTRGSSSWAAGKSYAGWSPTRMPNQRVVLSSPANESWQHAQEHSEALFNSRSGNEGGNQYLEQMAMSHEEDEFNHQDFSKRHSSQFSAGVGNMRTAQWQLDDREPPTRDQLRRVQPHGIGGSRMFQIALNHTKPSLQYAPEIDEGGRGGHEFHEEPQHLQQYPQFFDSQQFEDLGCALEPTILNAHSYSFVPSFAPKMSKAESLNVGIESPPTNTTSDSGFDSSHETIVTDSFCTEFQGMFQGASTFEEADAGCTRLSPIQNGMAPRRLFNTFTQVDPSEYRTWAAQGAQSGNSPSYFSSTSEVEPSGPAMPAAFKPTFCRQVEMFGGSGPSYKPDGDFKSQGLTQSCTLSTSQQPIPSPMPPKPKVVPFFGASEEIIQDDGGGIDKKTCDALLLNTLVYMVRSFGGGPIEQGRIGNALSKEEAVRTYIKDKHGSLINFLLGEGSSHFTVNPGVNGCYLVTLKKERM